MRRPILDPGWVVVAAIALTGCDYSRPEIDPKTPLGPLRHEMAKTSSAEPTPARFVVPFIEGEELDDRVAGWRGQVVFIDFWATWCEPCVDFFPHTVELHRKFGPRGLRVVSVSLDDADDAPKVERFLRDHDARFENFQSKLPLGQRATKSFRLTAGVPCFRLYGKDGVLAAEWSPATDDPRDTLAEIEKLIDEALARPADETK